MLNMRDDHSLLLYYDLMAYASHVNQEREKKVIRAMLASDEEELEFLKHHDDYAAHCIRYIAYVEPTGMML